jgi:hypothetical protein
MSKMNVLLALGAGAALMGCMLFLKSQQPPLPTCTTKMSDSFPVALLPYDSKGDPGPFDKESGTTFKVPTSVTPTGKLFKLGSENFHEISAPYKGWITEKSLECK